MSAESIQSRPSMREVVLYKLESDKISDNPKFNPSDYSRFKYGDIQIAREYAEGIFKLLIKGISRDKTFYLCGSAYNSVPTASFSITSHLHSLLIENGYDVRFFKISSKSFTEDYSTLTLKERKIILDTLSLEVLPEIASKIKNSSMIVVDDIKITGLHQKAIYRLAQKTGVKNVIFCYAASLQSNAEQNCYIEWKLNHFYINNLTKLYKIISNGHFLPNSRVCKFILSSSRSQIAQFSQSLSSSQREDLAQLMIKDGYHQMPRYKHSFLIFTKDYNN